MTAEATPAQVAIGEVEIEIRCPNNARLFFSPIGRSLRGRIDFSTAKTKSDLERRNLFPSVMPGVILGITADGIRYCREPLYEPTHRPLRLKIEEKGQQLGPERETFEGDTLLTYAYWMARAVESGNAVIVKGSLPKAEDLEGPRKRAKRDERFPRKDFLFAPQSETPTDRLTEAIDRLAANTAQQTAVMQRLLEKLK